MTKKKVSEVLPAYIDRNPEIDYYYVDIDCLYDTRLILLSLVDEKYAEEMLEDGSYFTRPNDSFPGLLTYHEFKDLYDQRGDGPEGLALLRAAPNTNFHIALNSYARKMASEGRRGGSFRPIGFVVNMYPYDIDIEEAEQLMLVLHKQLGGTSEVAAIYNDGSTLTPSGAMGEFVYLAKYDGPAWLARHQAEIQTKKYRDLFLACPALYLDKIPTTKQIEELKEKTKLDPFPSAEVTLSTGIGVQFLPVEIFSIYNEHHKLSNMSEKELEELFRTPEALQKILDTPIED